MTTPTPTTAATLPGVNVLLMGPAGTGKTHAIGTLVETGLDVCYLGLEPGLESLIGYFNDRGKPVPPNLYWHCFQAKEGGLEFLMEMAKQSGALTMDTLAQIKDMNRSKQNRYYEFLGVLARFVDQRTGADLGCTAGWGPDKVLVIDGLSGISEFAMEMVAGRKPTYTQPEYGVAQTNMLNLIRDLCKTFPCHFVLLAHVSRRMDEVMGGMKIFPKSPGKALNDDLPQLFSDVILAVREGDKFSWSTASTSADVKTRNLQIRDGLPPSFKPIIETWQARSKGGAGATVA